MFLGETRQCTQILLDHKHGSIAKQMNKDQRKPFKSSEAIFQTTSVPATQDFEIILALRLRASGPQCGSKESDLPNKDPCLPVFKSNVFWAPWVMGDARVIKNHQPRWPKSKHPEFALYWL